MRILMLITINKILPRTASLQQLTVRLHSNYQHKTILIIMRPNCMEITNAKGTLGRHF